MEQTGVFDASLVIAATDVDEFHILACILAKQFGVHTITVGVRDHDLDTDLTFSSNGTYPGVDIAINPDQQAAVRTALVIKNPQFSECEYRAGGKVQTLSLARCWGCSMP